MKAVVICPVNHDHTFGTFIKRQDNRHGLRGHGVQTNGGQKRQTQTGQQSSRRGCGPHSLFLTTQTACYANARVTRRSKLIFHWCPPFIEHAASADTHGPTGYARLTSIAAITPAAAGSVSMRGRQWQVRGKEWAGLFVCGVPTARNSPQTLTTARRSKSKCDFRHESSLK